MANRDPVIDEARKGRRTETRIIRPAGKRRLDALKQSKWTEARSARRTANRHRKEKNRLLRVIRHRRKVLSLNKEVRQNLMWYDGHQVAGWIVPFLDHARAHGWRGHVNGGVRSEQTAWYLWNHAGRLGLQRWVSVAYPCTSNHCGYIYPKGAVDVSDPWTFARLEHGRTINGKTLRAYMYTVGPRDPVHFSHTGH
jgi:hypothetical protein